MARSLWTGSLSFGLVNVPVAVLPAVRDVDLHFRQLHAKDGAPIDTLRFCSEEDKEISYDEVARSYELEPDDARGGRSSEAGSRARAKRAGEQVIVTDEELEAVQPERTRTIEIEQFVELSDVDPIYFDHPYFLVPAADDDGAKRAYRLLVEAMSRTDRAALGRFVMRAKEYLVIVRVRDSALTLTTMLFADEVRPASDVKAATQKSHKPSTKQLNAAVAVIEELTCDWEPGKYQDRYRKRLRDVVKRKQKGDTVKAPKQEPSPSVPPDLMAALEQTLAEMRDGGNGSGRREPEEARR
ncbi:MAG: Ku protein [Actinomycetota bacterium]|nr:Ku protein [Actinomycetota bacterium]